MPRRESAAATNSVLTAFQPAACFPARRIRPSPGEFAREAPREPGNTATSCAFWRGAPCNLPARASMKGIPPRGARRPWCHRDRVRRRDSRESLTAYFRSSFSSLLAQWRREPVSKLLSTARQARHHCSDRDFREVRYLPVGKPLEFAKDDGLAKLYREFLQRLLQGFSIGLLYQDGLLGRRG